jgi:hypothetical protein
MLAGSGVLAGGRRGIARHMLAVSRARRRTEGMIRRADDARKAGIRDEKRDHRSQEREPGLHCAHRSNSPLRAGNL